MQTCRAYLSCIVDTTLDDTVFNLFNNSICKNITEVNNTAIISNIIILLFAMV